jgi:hypothetical protein
MYHTVKLLVVLAIATLVHAQVQQPLDSNVFNNPEAVHFTAFGM